MAVRSVVEVEDGRAVVRRVGLGVDADLLRGNAEVLTAAAGVGVVAILRSGPADSGWELVTEHGGLPVDAGRLRNAAGVRALGAAVADVLARLHDLGVAHGRLEAEHVLVGIDGRPVLDGLVPTGGSLAGDVAALAGVLLRLVDDLPPTSERRERAARVHLRQLLADVDAADAERVPTARRFGASLTVAPVAGTARPTSRRGAVVVTVAAAIVVLSAVAVLTVMGRSSSSSTGAAAADRSTTTTTSSAEPPGSLPPCVVAEGASAAGCPHAVVVDGTTVTVDGQRAVVGRGGDEVLVGDWGCEGTPRPAVLRPATGEVLVYGPIEATGGPAVVTAERIEEATGLAADLDDQGCPTLLVVTPDGVLRLT